MLLHYPFIDLYWTVKYVLAHAVKLSTNAPGAGGTTDMQCAPHRTAGAHRLGQPQHPHGCCPIVHHLNRWGYHPGSSGYPEYAETPTPTSSQKRLLRTPGTNCLTGPYASPHATHHKPASHFKAGPHSRSGRYHYRQARLPQLPKVVVVLPLPHATVNGRIRCLFDGTF